MSATTLPPPDILVAREHVTQRYLQDLLDLLQHMRSDILHGRDAVSNLRLHALGQLRENASRLVRLQLRKNQTDRLRMLVGDKRRDLLR